MPRSAVGPLIASVLLIAIACNGGGEAQPTATPETEATTERELAVERGLEPPTVDSQELFVVDDQGGEPVLIHRTTGPIWLVAWSPDGSKLAFVSGRSLYIAEPTGEAGEPAAELEDSPASLAWSPGSDRLAVVVTSRSAPSHQSKILLVDPESPSPVEIYATTGESLRVIGWLPDGQRILAISDNALVTIDVAGGEVDEVSLVTSRGRRPASLSPDGTQLAFVGTSPGEDDCRFSLLIVDIGERTPNEAVTNSCYIMELAWSPDGAEIAYTTVPPEGLGGANVLDVASGESRLLTPPGIYTTAEWLADGSGLVVQQPDCYACHLSSYDVILVRAGGGSGQLLIAERPARSSDFGGFAPDARRYLYSDDAVRVATLDGGTVALTVSDPESRYVSLAWAPAGGRVAYVRSPNTTTRGYAVDVSTGEVTRRPVEDEMIDRQVGESWSPDGSKIAVWRELDLDAPTNEAVAGVYLVSGETSEEHELARFEVTSHLRFAKPAWSPDGSRVAIHVPAPRDAGIYVLEADGSAMAKVVATSSANGREYADIAWSPDGRQILFTSWFFYP